MRTRTTGGVALVGTLLLAACGSGPTTDDGEGASPGQSPDEVVELTMWTGFTGGDRGAYEELIETFNDTHADIQVTMEIQPWDTIAQTLPAAWATGQGPDLATPSFDPSVVAQYVETGSALPLDDVQGTGAGQIDTASLVPAAVDVFTIDGSLYAVPANVATLQLYYNRTLFEQAGIDAPPATAEELKASAVELTDEGGVYGLSLADHETIQMWPVLQWIDGGDIVDGDGCALIDDEVSIAGLQEWVDLVVEDGISPVGLTGAESDSLFSAGRAAMQINGPWAAAAYAEAGVDFGVASVPLGAGGEVTLASTVPLMIGQGTEHPEEAAFFLSWWTGQEAQRQFALASGFPPVRTDMVEDADLATDEVVQAFAAALPSARLYLPGVPNASRIDSEVYVPLIGEITRGADVAASARAAAEAIHDLTGCAS